MSGSRAVISGPNRWLEWLGRAALLASSYYFLHALWPYWLAERRLSTLALLCEEALILVLIFTRRDAARVSLRWREWAVALLSSIAPSWLRSYGMADQLLPLCLQLAGSGIAFAGLASLNLSFGIVPADRGVKTGGLYRWVRHPVYFGYSLSYTGYCLNHPSLYNAALGGLCIALFSLRIVYEERLLADDPAYAAYRIRTRWRLIPLLW